MKLVYFTISGNVERFVKKTGMEYIKIKSVNPYFEIGEEFILLVPTYELEATEPVWDFMRTGNNKNNCVGVVGSGNINFDTLYVFTAKDLSKDFNIPLIFDFELSGTDKDIENFKKEVAKFESS